MSGDIALEPILALARRASGHGRLRAPRATVTLDNPLCGDRIDLDIDWRDDGMITGIAHEVRGCVLCQAAASILGAGAPGRPTQDLVAASIDLWQMLDDGPVIVDAWPDLTVFRSVRGHKSRYSCVLLPFRAVLRAVGETGA